MSKNMIHKKPYSQNSFNLSDYKQLYDDFIWQVDPNHNLNIANQAVDKDLNTVI